MAGGGAAVTVTVDKRRSRRLAGVAVIAINRDQRERAREKERQLLDLRELHSLVNVCMSVCVLCFGALSVDKRNTHATIFTTSTWAAQLCCELRRRLAQLQFAVLHFPWRLALHTPHQCCTFRYFPTKFRLV